MSIDEQDSKTQVGSAPIAELARRYLDAQTDILGLQQSAARLQTDINRAEAEAFGTSNALKDALGAIGDGDLLTWLAKAMLEIQRLKHPTSPPWLNSFRPTVRLLCSRCGKLKEAVHQGVCRDCADDIVDEAKAKDLDPEGKKA